MKTTTHILGEGILQWNKVERQSDRYGFVCLHVDGSFDAGVPLNNLPESGTLGTLSVLILETRKSKHIGDLFNGIFPTETPAGTLLKLGQGKFICEQAEGDMCAGVEPIIPRKYFWLNPEALYACHAHVVRLVFTAEL